MKRVLTQDLARLRALAFRRHERCGALVQRMHAARTTINLHPDAEVLWHLYDWLLAPLSLWPIDFEGVAKFLIPLLEGKKKLHPHLTLLLRLVGPAPGEQAQKTLGAFEHDVARGAYEELVLQPAKFHAKEVDVCNDDALKRTWRLLKDAYRPERFANSRGVVRRRMSKERNFREGWEFSWRRPENRFQALFDALCYRWDLYGFQNDQPLLLKLTVNPTPHGTMIVIPRHWSFDKRRDLNWKKIRQLHRAHGVSPQGPKAIDNARARRSEDKRALSLWEEAKRNGIRGAARYSQIKAALKLTENTDDSCIRRMVRRARATITKTL